MAVICLLLTVAVLPAPAQSQSYEIAQPKGTWQVPGEIQQPKGPWQQPGAIQVPKGIQAVRATAVSRCEQRLSVVADALFDFDKANLRPDAEETLTAAAPEIAKLGKPTRIEGHTDAKGSDAYNLRLSEARATTVREWLAGRGFVPATTPIKGFGKSRPVAPNTTADGKDDPQGRQKNRRVEVVFDTCT
jgi:outer membrane protein OmpA-like peptidoglycan-associated protein